MLLFPDNNVHDAQVLKMHLLPENVMLSYVYYSMDADCIYLVVSAAHQANESSICNSVSFLFFLSLSQIGLYY